MDQTIRYEKDKQSSPDHVATPRYIVEDIYKIIGIENCKSIWLPFDNYDSEFKIMAEELGLKYKATHLFDDYGSDFFVTLPPDNCDLMISNPPFSIQNQIIERSFSLIEQGVIKSFALLLPLATLETEAKGKVYEYYKDKLSIIIFKKRIKFKGHTTSFNRGCVWVCYNVENLPAISWI